MSTKKGVSSQKPAVRSTLSLWNIGARKIITRLSGIILFAFFTIATALLQLPNAAGGIIALSPGSVILVVFGVFFGPLIGFLVGGSGSVVSDLIRYHACFWNWDLGNAFIGLVAGLVVFLTARRYRDTRSILLAEVASMLAVAIGTGFAASTDIWTLGISTGAAASEFLWNGISNELNGLLLLPIVLVIPNLRMRGSGRLPSRQMKRILSCVTLVGCGLVLLIASLFWVLRPQPSSPTNARVTINTMRPLGTLSKISIGLNTAVFDPQLRTNSTQAAIRNAGIGLLRFPGGLDSDLYHWQSHTLISGKRDPADTFDAFMQVVQSVKSQAMITVDYGAGTPAEAAGWVQYANKGGTNYHGPVPTYAGGSTTGHTYGITYWEIGNEVYGDGTYVTSWEYNNASHGPLAYARNVITYSHAMKKVDPTVKIGAVLTAPGIWPDGVISPLSRRPWNQTVLSTACSSLDFVVVHWYPQSPGSETDSSLLSSTSQIGQMVATLRAELKQFCGSHASEVQVMITETNSVSYHPGKQTVSQVNALFLADDYMTWLEDGATNVDWWLLHDGWAPTTFNNSSSLHGKALFGDYGMLSSALCSRSICEPPVDTPFPPYYGLQMLSFLGRAGDTMLTTTSNQNLIAAHAVKQADGKLALLLINKDPRTSSTVSLFLQGYTAQVSTTVYSYRENTSSITSLPGTATRVKIAPYSLTIVVLSPAF
jgi:uncharacterized membrane protein